MNLKSYRLLEIELTGTRPASIVPLSKPYQVTPKKLVVRPFTPNTKPLLVVSLSRVVAPPASSMLPPEGVAACEPAEKTYARPTKPAGFGGGRLGTLVANVDGGDGTVEGVGAVTGALTGLLTGALSGLLTGALTGLLTGELTGLLTGELTGLLTGALTGLLIGALTGLLTGALTGLVIGGLTGLLTGALTGLLTGAAGIEVVGAAKVGADGAAAWTEDAGPEAAPTLLPETYHGCCPTLCRYVIFCHMIVSQSFSTMPPVSPVYLFGHCLHTLNMGMRR